MRSEARVCVLTGAGVSAESGVPTFRGQDGLWSKFKPHELANIDAFLANPELVTAWYQHRRQVINEVEPNPGHRALVRMERHFREFLLVTQNVDGLHRRAGSRKVLELHGNIHDNKCIRCGRKQGEVVYTEGAAVPNCECGGLIRPDVVWFGELLPEGVLEEASDFGSRAALFFSLGTSAVVYPAAALPMAAKRHGAYLVEMNIERTELSDIADEVILAPTGQALPLLLEAAGIDGH